MKSAIGEGPKIVNIWWKLVTMVIMKKTTGHGDDNNANGNDDDDYQVGKVRALIDGM